MKPEEQQFHEKVKQARDLAMKGQYQQAAKLYSEVLNLLDKQTPDALVVQIELGWCYYNNQEYHKAIAQLEGALEHKEIDKQQQFDCQRLIGFSHSLLGRHQKAIHFLEQAIQIEIPPETKKFAYFELGKTLFVNSQIIESEHYLKIAKSLFSNEEEEYMSAIDYYLGFGAYFQKNFTRAKQFFEKIIEQSKTEKTRSTGFFGLAHLFYHQKNYTGMIDISEKILRLDPTFFDKETLGYFLCTSYLNLKMWIELETFFRELETNYPEGRYATEYPKFRNALENHSSQFKTGNRSPQDRTQN